MSKKIHPYKPFAIRLTDNPGGINPEVQILRVGKFKHPVYGEFEITPRILAEMKMNFESNVRGIDIAFDYFHESEKIAAGWLKGLELRENGTELWATQVDWTPKAKQMLTDKELRYFSPDFAFQWSDPESGKVFDNVLFGGGLTNRPFVKGMEPIVSLAELQELAGDPEMQACVAKWIPELISKGHTQDQAVAIAYSKCGEQKLSQLNLAEPSQDQLKQALEARGKKYNIEVVQDAHLTPPSGDPKDEADYGDPVNFKYPLGDKEQVANARVRFKQFASAYKKAASKAIVHERIVRKELALGVIPSFDPKDPLDAMLPSDIKTKLSGGNEKLSDNKGGYTMDEKDKKIAELEKMVADLKAQLDSKGKMSMEEQQQMQDKLQCSEKKVAELETQIATEKREKEFNVLLSEGKACAAQKEAFMKNDMGEFIAKAQPLNLGEGKGNGKTPADEPSGDAADQVMKLAEAKVASDKIALKDAVRLVLKENTELAKRYVALHQ